MLTKILDVKELAIYEAFLESGFKVWKNFCGEVCYCHHHTEKAKMMFDDPLYPYVNAIGQP